MATKKLFKIFKNKAYMLLSVWSAQFDQARCKICWNLSKTMLAGTDLIVRQTRLAKSYCQQNTCRTAPIYTNQTKGTEYSLCEVHIEFLSCYLHYYTRHALCNIFLEGNVKCRVKAGIKMAVVRDDSPCAVAYANCTTTTRRNIPENNNISNICLDNLKRKYLLVQ